MNMKSKKIHLAPNVWKKVDLSTLLKLYRNIVSMFSLTFDEYPECAWPKNIKIIQRKKNYHGVEKKIISLNFAKNVTFSFCFL